MLVSIKFSSEDAAKKAEGFELFKEVKLFDPVVYSRADDTEVKSIVSPSSKTYHTFGEDCWFDSCDEILAQLEDGDFDF